MYDLKIDRRKFIPSKEVHMKLDRNTIDQGVVAFINHVELISGSAWTINLYKLLQEYLLDLEKRDEINEIIHRQVKQKVSKNDDVD